MTFICCSGFYVTVDKPTASDFDVPGYLVGASWLILAAYRNLLVDSESSSEDLLASRCYLKPFHLK